MAEISLSEVRLRLGENEVLKGVTFTVPDVEGRCAAWAAGQRQDRRFCARSPASNGRMQARSASATSVVFDAAEEIDVPAHKRGIGFQFQTDALWPDWTVFDNVAYCAQSRQGRHR